MADGQRAICLRPEVNGWMHLKSVWRIERNSALDRERGSDKRCITQELVHDYTRTPIESLEKLLFQ